MKVYRIVVAHDVSRRCREELGGSGSLMLAPTVGGAGPLPDASAGTTPFTIGHVDPAKGFVHVLDDASLEMVMSSLDTVTDFVSYLRRKEDLILSGRPICAAGEEELLAYYLRNVDEGGEHNFIVPANIDGLAIQEGLWKDFRDHPKESLKSK